MPSNNSQIKEALYNRAIILALIMIFNIIIEGIISIFFGLGDETIALFGFGVDSFVEVISGIGGLDSIGAILIAVLSFKEGRESFQKARGITCCTYSETFCEK